MKEPMELKKTEQSALVRIHRDVWNHIHDNCTKTDVLIWDHIIHKILIQKTPS